MAEKKQYENVMYKFYSMNEFLADPRELISLKEIGHGAFGKVNLMRDPKKENKVYAVKTEEITAKIPQLQYEFRVYKKLHGIHGIPNVFALWQHEGHTHMAMQLLGPSLEKHLNDITLWDIVTWIGPKTIAILEQIHARGFLHRDIKPENMLLSIAGLRGREIFLVDYGLCKRYRMNAFDHIPYKDGKRLTGTVRYASVHTHLGEEQSRRDDLESLGYVLVYLIKRKLPWMNAGGNDKKEQSERIMSIKIKHTIEELCEGLPTSFVHYFRHVRALTYEQTPDYSMLRNFFKQV